jgi:hypothetical protein
MDLGERLFHGEWSVGPFHCYPFRLTKRGSHTILHAHGHDHLVSANKPIAVYRLGRDGGEEVIPVPSGDRRLVAAHAEHLIVALEDDTECECLFSRYDERGEFLADPKEDSRQPYHEPCNEANLPAFVREFLAKHPS